MSQNSSNLIPIYLTKDYFKNVLEYGMREKDINIKSFDIEKLNLGGENYCSNIYRSKISYKIEKNDGIQEMSLIIKSMPKEKQATLAALQIYLKESIFYLDIKPKLETLMWHIADGTEWRIGARHLYSTSLPEETIIFEDLCGIGFELQSRQIGLDFLHSKLVLQKLAEYHALTMIMAEREPQTIIERYPFGLLNKYTIESKSFKDLSSAQILKLAELIEHREGFAMIAHKLRNFLENFEEKLSNAIYPMEGAINALNHGDMWVNNLFFKYETPKVPVAVQFIDFQLCFYGSIGFDIIYFLMTSVRLDVLKTQREILLEIYYESLIKTLKSLSWKETLPTYNAVINEIQRREMYGLFVAIAFFPLISMDNVDSHDLSLDKLQNPEFIDRKLQLMFMSNPRTMNTLLYFLDRANKIGILD